MQSLPPPPPIHPPIHPSIHPFIHSGEGGQSLRAECEDKIEKWQEPPKGEDDIYIYVYICVCVCIYTYVKEKKQCEVVKPTRRTNDRTNVPNHTDRTNVPNHIHYIYQKHRQGEEGAARAGRRAQEEARGEAVRRRTGAQRERRWVEGWMDGGMDGWMGGWMEGCTLYIHIIHPPPNPSPLCPFPPFFLLLCV